jgi:hypothetical protein
VRRGKAKGEKFDNESRKAGIESVPAFLLSLLRIFLPRAGAG